MTATASPSPKPLEFGNVGDYWANEGWLVKVGFIQAPKMLCPRDQIARIGPLLPRRHSPIQSNGNGNQGCYLAAIPEVLGHLLLALIDADDRLPARPYLAVHEPAPEPEVLADLRILENSRDIPETQKLQLAKARIGQGLFRRRVILLDPACRVTGVSDPRVLVASHIKAWKDASNAERISGFNGILLSPHVDALFDGHLITFEDDGRMHVHASLPEDVLDRWSINPSRRVEAFRPGQSDYLAHHRAVFARKIA